MPSNDQDSEVAALRVLGAFADCPARLSSVEEEGKLRQIFRRPGVLRYFMARLGRSPRRFAYRVRKVTLDGDHGQYLDQIYELTARAMGIVDNYPEEEFLKARPRPLARYTYGMVGRGSSRKVKGFLEDLYKGWLSSGASCILILEEMGSAQPPLVVAFSVMLPLSTSGRKVIETPSLCALDLKLPGHLAGISKEPAGILLDMYVIRSGRSPEILARFHRTMFLRHLAEFHRSGSERSWPDLLVEPDVRRYQATCEELNKDKTSRPGPEGTVPLWSYVIGRQQVLGWPGRKLVSPQMAEMRTVLGTLRGRMGEIAANVAIE
jgi:hypothetical protein